MSSNKVDYKQRLFTVINTLSSVEGRALENAEQKIFIDKAFGDEFFDSLTMSLGHHNNFEEGQLLPGGDSEKFQFRYFKESIKAAFSEGIDSQARFVFFLNKHASEPIDIDKLMLSFKGNFNSSHNKECDCCGARLKFEFDFDTLTLGLDEEADDCMMHNYVPEAISMPVPSMRVVAANDLRRLFPEIEESDEYAYFKEKSNGNIHAGSLSSNLGSMINTQFHLQFDLLYLQMSNCAINVFQKEDEISISTLDPEEDDVSALGNYLGDTDSSLWAINMVDESVFKKRAEALGMSYDEAMNEFNAISFDIPGDELSLTSDFSFDHDDLPDIAYVIKTPESPKNRMR